MNQWMKWHLNTQETPKFEEFYLSIRALCFFYHLLVYLSLRMNLCVYVFVYICTYVYYYIYMEWWSWFSLGGSKCSYYLIFCSVINTALSTIYRFVLKYAVWYSRVYEIQPLSPCFCHFPQTLIIPGSLSQLNHSGFLLSSEPLLPCPLPVMPLPLFLPCSSIPNSNVNSSRICPHEN